MIYFSYLTDNAYVQTGEYKVEEFYREGYHVLQRVQNVLGDGDTVATAFPYTVTSSGTHTITFTGTDDGTSTDGVSTDFDITVNGVNVGTTLTVPDSDSASTTQTFDLKEGDVVDVDIEATGDGAVSAVSIVQADRAMPESFYREWATFAEGRDDELGYDPGAYGIGVPVSRRNIIIPRVKQVSLLYLFYLSSTKEERTLVQYDGDLTALEAADLVTSGGGRRVFTEEEYIDTFAAEGFNRYGYVMPPNMERSQVQELSLYTGDFVDVDDNVVSSAELYLQPIYMYQSRPMFDFVYVQAGFRGDLDPAVTGISGHLFRWQGQFRSEAVAPINRAGDPVLIDGYTYYIDANGDLIEQTPLDTDIEQDGQTYTNADSYNVRNYRRH